MAYRKFNIYSSINMSERAVTVAIIIGLIALAALMVIGNRVGFTASFESNGTVISEQHLHYGEKVSEPDAPTREGYVFTGWYSDTARTKKYDFTRSDLNDDVTIYAAWKKAETTVNSVPLHFENNKNEYK